MPRGHLKQNKQLHDYFQGLPSSTFSSSFLNIKDQCVCVDLPGLSSISFLFLGFFLVFLMGNCQASDAASVMLEHPNGKVEWIYWSVTANEVMGSNPGHYVALVTKSNCDGADPQKQLKLLRPDDTLHIGHNYRLVSFEEVLMEFPGKNYVQLNKLLSSEKVKGPNPHQAQGLEVQGLNLGRGIGGTRSMGRQGQWRPALQSISEAGR